MPDYTKVYLYAELSPVDGTEPIALIDGERGLTTILITFDASTGRTPDITGVPVASITPTPRWVPDGIYDTLLCLSASPDIDNAAELRIEGTATVQDQVITGFNTIYFNAPGPSPGMPSDADLATWNRRTHEAHQDYLLTRSSDV